MSMGDKGVRFQVELGSQNKNKQKGTYFPDFTRSMHYVKQEVFGHKYLDALFGPWVLRCYLIYTDNNAMYVLLSYLNHSKLCC